MKLSNNAVKDHWNKVGSNYSDSWKNGSKIWMSNQEIGFISENLKPFNKQKSICLDVGSGNGRIVDVLISCGFSNIIATDISSEMVSILKDRYSKNTSIRDIRKISSISDIGGKYDLITVIRVLKYNVCWKDHLNHLVDLLNPGGLLIFTMPNIFSSSFFSIYPIAKYKVSVFGLNKHLRKLPVDIVEMKSMFRLPDFLYSSKMLYDLNVVTSIEDLLNKFLPKVFAGKEFFVAIKKI